MLYLAQIPLHPLILGLKLSQELPHYQPCVTKALMDPPPPQNFLTELRPALRASYSASFLVAKKVQSQEFLDGNSSWGDHNYSDP